MKKRIIEYVKNNAIVNKMYNFFFGNIINIFKFFVKTDDKLILFSSFGGNSFDDSPRIIYEQMKQDVRFNEYKLIWAFQSPQEYSEIPSVKIDTLKYFHYALKSRVWITNSSMERGLHFKGRDTFYINTWHGSPIKKMGIDINNGKHNSVKIKEPNYDLFCVQSEYESEIFEKAFKIKKDIIQKIGLPRNDILVNVDTNEVNNIKNRLGLYGKKIILYAPTFREYGKDVNKFNFKMNMDLRFWSENLDKNSVLLLRNHYDVQTSIHTEFENILDVSNYQNLNHLLLISDILISDYSSIIFDFSIMKKPILCYGYDLKEYEEQRGMYLDLEKIFGKIYEDEVELVNDINNCSVDATASNYILNNYLDYYGQATEGVVGLICRELLINRQGETL